MTPSKKKKVSSGKQPNRQQLLTKLQKAIKSQYKYIPANTSRPIIEQVLFACCLENAHYDVAEKAYETLMENYFDLNEVRVTTVAELAESLPGLPDPKHAALSLRRVLQGVFESTYTFSLDHAKKHSLSHGVKTLQNLYGIPPFVVSFITGTTLGGHAIALDRGALGALYLCGIISRDEYDAGVVTGLERIIPKKSGAEFNSLLHQLGADCISSLHGTVVKKVVQSVDPVAVKERFPKRGAKLPRQNPSAPVSLKAGQKSEEAKAEELRPAGPQAAARPAGKTPMPPPGSGPKRTADGKPVAGGKPGPKPFVVKPNMGRPLTVKSETTVSESTVAKTETSKKGRSDASRAKKKKAQASSAKAKTVKVGKKKKAKKKASKSKASVTGASSKKSSKKTKKKSQHSSKLKKRKPR